MTKHYPVTKLKLASLFVAAAGVFASAGANAGLTLLQPDPATSATFVGRGGYSADGLGQNGIGGALQAEVPAGSTVVQAYLYGTYFTLTPDAASLAIDFDGSNVVLQKISDVGSSLSTARVDVTAQVAAKVGAGGGLTDFIVNSDPASLDGLALVVIYSNPVLPTTTIAVLDGSASQLGDTATFNFATPLDKTTPGFSAVMSLGAGFSFQGVSGHGCGGGQYSNVYVNGIQLTDCAGNYDDGTGGNGGLITVGGVGDSIDNPTLPATVDDELYNLEPLLAQGDPAITITSANPSQNDNLMLAVVAITAAARVTTEVCNDGIDNDGDGLTDSADPDCNVAPPVEICTDGIDNDLDGLVDSADPDCQLDTRRMTGGGSLLAGKSRVQHGFALACDFSTPGTARNLQVNWGKGNRFHLEAIDSIACSDAPEISEGKPAAGFDTLSGGGSGRYNGVSGATAEWVITDAGEPGTSDTFAIRITDANGFVVLDQAGTLGHGNQQAHP